MRPYCIGGNFKKIFVVQRTDDNGEVLPIIKKSTQNMMRYKNLNGEKVWLSTIKTGSGYVTGHFSSIIGGIIRYIINWT